jgi:hypothetical protein
MTTGNDLTFDRIHHGDLIILKIPSWRMVFEHSFEYATADFKTFVSRKITRIRRGSQRRSATILAYLDPASSFAAVQIVGAGAAWLYMRLKGVLPKKWRPPKRVIGSVRIVEAASAVAELIAPCSQSRLVVIIEGARDWPYVGPAIAALGQLDRKEIWVVSRTSLPLEELQLLTFGVSAAANVTGPFWATLTSRLRADGAITTITDLGTRVFQKSPFCDYIYIFHSLMSTHVSYTPGAFDSYDLLLCPSIVHVEELHCRDARLGRINRRAAEVGYPLLQKLTKHFETSPPSNRVVIAPSWSSDDLYEQLWPAAVDALVAAGWLVTIRPHPETLKRSPDAIALLAGRYADSEAVSVDTSANDGGGLEDLDALITDWSGAGTEVALAGRPVVFVDAPRKIRNVEWKMDGERSIEEDARASLGTILRPEEIDSLPQVLTYRSTGPSASAFRDRVVSKIPDAASASAFEILEFLGWNS